MNNLPEEIINYIYKFVFTDCLQEIKTISFCTMCSTFLPPSNLVIKKCINCHEPICLDCWETYCMNYYRGWKPFIKHCQSCAIEKTRDLYLNPNFN